MNPKDRIETIRFSEKPWLQTRFVNALIAAGMKTVADVAAELAGDEFRYTPNIGPASVEAIRAAMADLSRPPDGDRGDIPDAFDQFGILEVVGHRRLGGRVREASIGGVPLLRIDVIREDGPPVTQYYGAAAIFCLTPATEEAARAASAFVPPLDVYKIEARANARAEEELGRAVAVLQTIEWSGLDLATKEPCCPFCRAPKSEGAHDCALAAIIADDEIPF